MWFAVAILGVIAIAAGITLLPGSHPQPAPAVSAPALPASSAATPPPDAAPDPQK